MRGHIRKQCRCKNKAACKHRWEYIVDVGRSETGRRTQKSKGGFRTKTEAERACREFLRLLDRGPYIEPTKQTVAEYLRAWLEGIQVRPATADSYRMNVETRIIPEIGGVKAQKLTPQMLDAMYRRLETSGGKDGKGLSPRSVRYAHTVLRKALADGVRKGILLDNPADRADPPKLKRHDMKTWTADELRVFLESVRDERLFAAWQMAAMTGMRRGELLGLRWTDVDLDGGRVAVRHTLVEVGGEVIDSQPKTERGRRSIPLDPRTLAALKVHRARQLEERLQFGPSWPDTGLVFVREDGTPIHPVRFSRWFEKRARAAALPRIRFHDLRHTYASLALAAGVSAKVVSDHLGHATVSITLDVYSHVTPQLQEDASSRVAALVFGGHAPPNTGATPRDGG